MSRLATELFDFWPISTPTVGTVTEESVKPRSGPGAGAFPSGAFNIIEPTLTAETDQTLYFRFAVRIDALPSTTTSALRLLDETGTVLEVSITSAGVLSLFNQVELTHPTGTQTITPGDWNVVEIALHIPSAGKGKISWRFNGVDKAVEQEMGFRNLGIFRPRFGNPGVISSGVTTYIDDVAINNDLGGKDDTWVGVAADPIPELLSRYWGSFIAENSEATLGIEKAPYDLEDTLWDEFEEDAGRTVGILHLGDPWTKETGPEWDGFFAGGRTSKYVHERGAILMKDLGGPANVIQDVNTGAYDGSIEAWAKAARGYRHPMFLRLWWEMNGNWFDWGREQCTGAEYTEAWRRLHGIVHPIAPNCTFVWCPNVLFEGHTDPFGDEEKETESMYPGDAYVDWMGMDGYTGQNPHKQLGWRTSKAVFLETYERLQVEAGHLPIMVCETAASEYFTKEAPAPPHKAEWIKQFLQWTLPYEMPNIRALVWFNWFIEEGGGRIDWPIETSTSATEAFAESVGDPLFVDPDVRYFRSLSPVPLPGESTRPSTRRKPPLELDVEIETTNGTFRLPADADKAGNRPQGLTGGSQRGEGFSQGALILPRQIFRDYPDIGLLDTWRAIGRNGDVAYEGRLHSVPRTNSPQEQLEIALVGWATYLKGRPVSPLIIDRRLEGWGEPSTQRVANLLTSGFRQEGSVSTGWQGSGELGPGVAMTMLKFDTAYKEINESWFYAGGEDIGFLAFDQKQLTENGIDEGWFSNGALSPDDVEGSGTVQGTDYNNSDHAEALVTAEGPGSKYARLQAQYTGAFEGEVNSVIAYLNPAVIGTHGLELIGSGIEAGYRLTDILQYILRTYYPKVEWAGSDNSFVMQQATWHDAATDGFSILQQLNELVLWEPAVWEERKLHFEPADLTTYDWIVRSDEPGIDVGLQGDSIENFANGIVVSFTDVLSQRARTLYPDEHSELLDESEDNPANKHGESLWTQTSVPWNCSEAEALQYGRAALAEFNRPKRPGTITVTGHIKDGAGNWHPYWKPRAGETVGIMDNLAESEPRLIYSVNWDDASKTATIQVDAPDQTLPAIVARHELAFQARNL